MIIVDKPRGFFESQKKAALTVFEYHSLIQDCQRSELRLHFEWTKVQ